MTHGFKGSRSVDRHVLSRALNLWIGTYFHMRPDTYF